MRCGRPSALLPALPAHDRRIVLPENHKSGRLSLEHSEYFVAAALTSITGRLPRSRSANRRRDLRDDAGANAVQRPERIEDCCVGWRGGYQGARVASCTAARRKSAGGRTARSDTAGPVVAARPRYGGSPNGRPDNATACLENCEERADQASRFPRPRARRLDAADAHRSIRRRGQRTRCDRRNRERDCECGAQGNRTRRCPFRVFFAHVISGVRMTVLLALIREFAEGEPSHHSESEPIPAV